MVVFIHPNKNNVWKYHEHIKKIQRNPFDQIDLLLFSFFLLKLKSYKNDYEWNWKWFQMHWPPFFMTSVLSGCGSLSPATNPIASNPKQIKNIALLLCILQNVCTSCGCAFIYITSLRCRIERYLLCLACFWCGISFGFNTFLSLVCLLFLLFISSFTNLFHNQQTHQVHTAQWIKN